MCGIAGVFNGTSSFGEAKGVNPYMRQACVAGIFRGEDSTGLMQIKRDGAVRVRRSTLNGYEFGQQKKIDAIFENTDTSSATILHHRKATQGSITIENCHPFEHESTDGRYVCGVHNGTLYYAPSEEDNIKFDVDSDWLFYKIAKDGAEKALGLVEHGAYAVVWYEQDKTGSYYKIACNGDRPFHWAYVKDKNLMLMASEDSMLYWLADRNNLVIEEMFTPKKGLIYTFDPDGNLREYTTTNIEKAEKPLTYSYSGADGDWDSIYDRPSEKGAARPDKGFGRVANVAGSHYVDYHGPAGLVDTPFLIGQEVDFVFQKAYKNRQVENHWEARGEIILDIDGKPVIWNAAMTCIDNIQIENVKRANTCWAKVYGLRHEISNETGLINIMLIVSPPSVIMIDGDDTIPETTSLLTLEELYENDPEVPWEENGLDEAIGNVLSGRTVRGPGGRYISLARWKELTRDGCGDCGENLLLHHAEELGWHNDSGGPLCPKCIDNWFENARALA